MTKNGIYVFDRDEVDIDTTGLVGDLQPVSCTFTEEKNGESGLEMRLCYDELNKWAAVKPGCYIKAMVPVRVPPRIVNGVYTTEVTTYRVKTTITKTATVYQSNGTVVDQTTVQNLGRPRPEIKALTLTQIYWHDEPVKVPVKVKYRLKAGAEVQLLAEEGEKAKIYAPSFGTGWTLKSNLETVKTTQILGTFNGVEAVTDAVRLQYQLFQVTSVEQSLDGVDVTAQHVFYELLTNYTTYKTDDEVYCADAINGVFGGMTTPDERFTCLTDCKDKSGPLDYDRVNIVQALLDPENGICARYGLSLVRNNYDLYALKNVGSDRGFVVEYGKNMLDLNRTEDISNVITRIIPYGKTQKGDIVYMDGTPYLDSKHVSEYSTPRTMYLDCSDTATESKTMTLAQVKEELKKRAQAEFDAGCDLPELSMTVDFLSLGDTEEYRQYRDLDKVFLFDKITVRDRVRGYDYTAEVVAITHNVLTGLLESVTLGSIEKGNGQRKIATWQVPEVDGSNIRLASIAAGVLAGNAVNDENLQDDSVTTRAIRAQSVTTEKLAAGSITADKIEAGSVTTEKLAAGAVTADTIAAGAISTEKLQAGAVDADKIASNAVTAGKIDAEAVTADKIAAGAVSAVKIAAGAVTAGKIAAGAIDADKLAANSVTAGKIAVGAVEAGNIAAHAVTTEKIATGAITAGSGIIAESAIGTTQIADASITDAKIVGLTASKLTAGTIDASEIAVVNLVADNITTGTINGQIIPVLGSDKLAAGAVTGEKIAKNAVTADKIVAGAVTTDKLAANAVTANKILSGAVTTDKLSASAVTADKIAAGAITTSKVSSDFGSTLDLSSNKSISLIVDGVETDINALESRVTSSEAAIKLNKNAIQSKVSKTDFDNLIVGDENLIIGSANTYSIAIATRGDTGSDSGKFEHGDGYPYKWCRFDGSVNGAVVTTVPRALAEVTGVKVGSVYTFSADVQNYGNTMRIVICPISSSNQMIGNALYYADSDIFHGYKRLSVTSSPLPAGTAKVWVYIEKFGDGNTYFDTRKWMLVEGNKSTSWSPAPADAQIGGRNLLVKENFHPNTTNGGNVSDWGWASKEISISGWGAIVPVNISAGKGFEIMAVRNLSLKTNRYYTVSFTAWAHVLDGTRILHVDLYPDSLPERNFTLTSTITRYTWTLMSSNSNMSSCSLRFFFDAGDSQATNKSVHITDVKLEEGINATTWTPAPEDTDTRISNAETKIEQTAAGIRSEASATYATKSDLSTTNGNVSSLNGNVTSLWTQAEQTAAGFSLISSKIDGDLTNYAQLNDYTASHWGFTADSTADGHWFKANTLKRDLQISEYFPCVGGEEMEVSFSISSTVKGILTNGGTDIGYTGSTVSIFGRDSNGGGRTYTHAFRFLSDASGTVGVVEQQVIKIPKSAKNFAIYIQTDGWGSFSGTLKVRDVVVRKVPKNVKSTTVTINDNGMDVATGGKINFHTNNFNVTPPNGNDQLFSVSASDHTVRAQRGYFDSYLYAPNMATIPTKTGRTIQLNIGGDSGFPSIQAAWDSLPDVCGNVYFEVKGNVSGHSVLKDKYVSYLRIRGTGSSENYTVGRLDLIGINNFEIYYVTMNWDSSEWDSALLVSGGTGTCYSSKIASSGCCVKVKCGANLMLNLCDMSGYGSYATPRHTLIQITRATCCIDNCYGGLDVDGVHIYESGFVVLTGFIPGKKVMKEGGYILGTPGTDYILDGSTPTPPATVTSSTFSASTCVTWQRTSGSTWKIISSSVGTKVESRHSTLSDGFDYRAGWWVLDTGTAIKSALSGKTIKKATITIRRNDTWSDSRTCHLCYHSMVETGKMNGIGSPVSGIGSLTGAGIMTSIAGYSLAPSAQTVITLPSSVYSKLQDGTIKGFGLVDHSTDYKQIMCDNTCTLTVTY